MQHATCSMLIPHRMCARVQEKTDEVEMYKRRCEVPFLFCARTQPPSQPPRQARMLHVACCMLHAACCMLHTRTNVAAHIHAQTRTLARRFTDVECSMLHVACCMSHVACRMLHVACCMLHVACRMSHVACRMLHVVCCRLAHCISQVACCRLACYMS